MNALDTKGMSSSMSPVPITLARTTRSTTRHPGNDEVELLRLENSNGIPELDSSEEEANSLLVSEKMHPSLSSKDRQAVALLIILCQDFQLFFALF